MRASIITNRKGDATALGGGEENGVKPRSRSSSRGGCELFHEDRVSTLGAEANVTGRVLVAMLRPANAGT